MQIVDCNDDGLDVTAPTLPDCCEQNATDITNITNEVTITQGKLNDIINALICLQNEITGLKTETTSSIRLTAGGFYDSTYTITIDYHFTNNGNTLNIDNIVISQGVISDNPTGAGFVDENIFIKYGSDISFTNNPSNGGNEDINVIKSQAQAIIDNNPNQVIRWDGHLNNNGKPTFEITPDFVPYSVPYEGANTQILEIWHRTFNHANQVDNYSKANISITLSQCDIPDLI